MTILEATNRLLEFFVQNDYFELENDFKKVCLISDTDADKAAILIALEGLAKDEFVKKKDMSNKEFWVLVKPVAMHQMDVSISVTTAFMAATVINKFIKKEEDKCNPLRISEQDIANLILIASKT